MNRNRILLTTFFFVLVVVIVIQVYGQTSTQDDLVSPSAHTQLGAPALLDTKLNEIQLIISRNEYVISYNPNLGCPQWVAWELNSSWIGDAPRKSGKFLQDTSIPKEFRISHDDYTHSGFNRGHVVRSKERTNSKESNRATFYMTNVLPQTPDLNQGVWLDFEYHCEKLARDGYQLYLTAGGTFNDTTTLMGKGKVVIPDSCFKAVVSIKPRNQREGNASDTSFIAIMMPNIQGVRKDPWEKYATTFKHIESSTKMDIFPEIH